MKISDDKMPLLGLILHLKKMIRKCTWDPELTKYFNDIANEIIRLHLNNK